MKATDGIERGPSRPEHRRRAVVRDVLQAVFRMLPWPTEPGLRPVGRPGPDSPVVVTGNYDLTVRRLVRALHGCDVWLVVAPSQGVNVWCAAAGGHFTTHQVVGALKTSGVEERVRHRRAVLPQLAATGVQAPDVARRCGWTVRFGPVYADDLPAYLRTGMVKTDPMRRVRFDTAERWQMATAWAGPASLVVGLGAWMLRPPWILPLLAFIWGLCLAAFHLHGRRRAPGRVTLVAAGAAAFALAVFLTDGTGSAAAAGAVVAAVLAGILTFDVDGSSPITASPQLDGHSWRITLDAERCKGTYLCWNVCPEACFDKRPGLRKVELTHPERCVRCASCIVQCPVDALAFEDEAGTRIAPDVIRRFKLNLLGRRSVAVDADAAGDAD